mmetsp:Transcript_36024/g.71292  ORF Transcript_36024/g.71292 Transcript_36024/m.71292 type:complete len:227 (-) Transcript_36024:1228-1908(-)
MRRLLSESTRGLQTLGVSFARLSSVHLVELCVAVSSGRRRQKQTKKRMRTNLLRKTSKRPAREKQMTPWTPRMIRPTRWKQLIRTTNQKRKNHQSQLARLKLKCPSKQKSPCSPESQRNPGCPSRAASSNNRCILMKLSELFTLGHSSLDHQRTFFARNWSSLSDAPCRCYGESTIFCLRPCSAVLSRQDHVASNHSLNFVQLKSTLQRQCTWVQVIRYLRTSKIA